MSLTFDELDRLRRAALGVSPPSREQEQEARELLMNGIRKNPLFAQYHYHIMAGAHKGQLARNTAPWHALGERLMAAMELALVGSVPELPAPELERSPGKGVPYATQALLAVPYLWRADIVEIANSGPLPKHVISREMLSAPLMFWSFETAYESRRADGEERLEFNWVLVIDQGDRVVFLNDTQDGLGQKASIRVGALRYGTTWPDDYPDPEYQQFLLRLSAFLASPLIDSSGTRMGRPERRRLMRHGYTTETQDEEIRVVKLRRKQPPRKPAGEPGDEVDWHYRWWVSGHYRAQWYPSLAAHRVIWVSPYLKGPDDKPLLEKVYDVAR